MLRGSTLGVGGLVHAAKRTLSFFAACHCATGEWRPASFPTGFSAGSAVGLAGPAAYAAYVRLEFFEAVLKRLFAHHPAVND